MARRVATNLNNMFKLDSRRVEEFIRQNGKDLQWLAESVCMGIDGISNCLQHQRIPSQPYFNRLAEVMKTQPESLLLKFVN